MAALGSQYTISLSATNCSTGDSLARAQIEADGKEKVLAALGKAVSQMRGKLGESLASIQKFDAPAEQVTTSSLEAFQAFSLGTAKRDQGAGHQDCRVRVRTTPTSSKIAAIGACGLWTVTLMALMRGNAPSTASATAPAARSSNL